MTECLEGYRICKTCGECKPETAEYFRLHSKHSQGFRRQCRICTNTQKAKKRHGKNYESHLEKQQLKQTMKDAGQKQCSKCKQVFPATLEYFYARPNRKSGLQSWCKNCERYEAVQYMKLHPDKQKLKNEKTQEKRKADPEKTKAQARKARAKNPELHNERTRQWRKKDPEWYREYNATYANKWRAKNIDRARESQRNRLRKHPERVKATHAKRRFAKEANGANDFTAADWRRALDYFDHRCAVCGKPVDEQRTICPDHWKPLSKGGENTATNIVPLCHSKPNGRGGCNNSKQKSDAFDWLKRKFGEGKALEILHRIEVYFEWVRGQ